MPEDDHAFATRLASPCARTPVALERLTYDRAAKAVTYRSDKADILTGEDRASDDALSAIVRGSGNSLAEFDSGSAPVSE